MGGWVRVGEFVQAGGKLQHVGYDIVDSDGSKLGGMGQQGPGCVHGGGGDGAGWQLRQLIDVFGLDRA